MKTLNRLSRASEQVTNRRVVQDYFIAGIDAGEIWRGWLFEDYRAQFQELFGPRLHTVMDSARRRLDVWHVDQPDWPVPFWIISHRDRGTSYEVLATATDEQCLALVKKLAEVLNGNGTRM
jgi:hypothetical protein